MTATTTSSPSFFDDLRPSAELELLGPHDPGFEAACMAWNTAYRHQPLAIARPRSTAGVTEALDLARARGVAVAIQATGHGPTSRADGAILLDLRHLDDVRIDVAGRRASVGGGAKWQAVLDAVAPHDLAPLLGSTPDVGAVGYTLGGGIGWLVRRFGTAADSVRSFEVVTADGRVVLASAQGEEELYWALRGGGAGHLGVVTAMEIELYPVPSLYAGSLFYPAAMAAEVLRRWRDWLPVVPAALTSSVVLMNYPPLEQLPPHLRGASFALVRGAYAGDVDEGERLMQYWRDWQAPEFDHFGLLPLERVAEISQDPVDPLPYEATGQWLSGLSDSTIDAIIAATIRTDAPPRFVFSEIRHTARPALPEGESLSASTAYGASMLLEIVAVTPDDEAAARARAEMDELVARIPGDLTGRTYLNFVEGERRRQGVERAFGRDAYRRLAAIKARIDPDDLFAHGLDVTASLDHQEPKRS